jgi:hypothetical protein
MLEAMQKHAIDTSSRTNQVRYLHTLSVVAAACVEGSSEATERCFVEWPPKAAYRHGEVNDI